MNIKDGTGPESIDFYRRWEASMVEWLRANVPDGEHLLPDLIANAKSEYEVNQSYLGRNCFILLQLLLQVIEVEERQVATVMAEDAVSAITAERLTVSDQEKFVLGLVASGAVENAIS